MKAIDAYRSIPLDKNTWHHGGRDCWSRAISLAQMLKTGAGDRLEQMETLIIAAFNAATQADGFLGLGLANLLKSNGLGKTHQAVVSSKLETLARELNEKGDLHRAREFFSTTAEWYKAVPDASKAAEMTTLVAESWVKEAIAQVTANTPSYMVAASFYEKMLFKPIAQFPKHSELYIEWMRGLVSCEPS